MKREEKKRALEEHIYDVAIDMFCTLGYKETTLVGIAEGASVSTRTLHSYFPTKESILRRFTRENILALKDYAATLPAGVPVKDKVLQVMVYDFKSMFCLFDVNFILNPFFEKGSDNSDYEIENIAITERIYANLLSELQCENKIEPNQRCALAASVLVGIYRHCADLYRYRRSGAYSEDELERLFTAYLTVIWDGMVRYLTEPVVSVDDSDD